MKGQCQHCFTQTGLNIKLSLCNVPLCSQSHMTSLAETPRDWLSRLFRLLWCEYNDVIAFFGVI